MLVPKDTTTEEWAKRYDLSLEAKPCKKCGIPLKPTIPFAENGFRGLMSEPHPCGAHYDLRRYAPTNKEDNQGLKDAYLIMSDAKSQGSEK